MCVYIRNWNLNKNIIEFKIFKVQLVFNRYFTLPIVLIWPTVNWKIQTIDQIPENVTSETKLLYLT